MSWAQPEPAVRYARQALAYAEQNEVYNLASYIAVTRAWLQLRAGEWDEAERLTRAELEKSVSVAHLVAKTVLAELAGQVDRRVRWYYTPVARQRGKQSWIEHRELIAAIVARDEPRATQVMRTHTEHTRTTYHQRNAAAAAEAASASASATGSVSPSSAAPGSSSARF